MEMGHVHDSRETGVSGLDKELTLPKTLSKGPINETRRLSDDTIKEMVASSGKKHLLTTEVTHSVFFGLKEILNPDHRNTLCMF